MMRVKGLTRERRQRRDRDIGIVHLVISARLIILRSVSAYLIARDRLAVVRVGLARRSDDASVDLPG